MTCLHTVSVGVPIDAIRLNCAESLTNVSGYFVFTKGRYFALQSCYR
jgi:hypothetical protein